MVCVWLERISADIRSRVCAGDGEAVGAASRGGDISIGDGHSSCTVVGARTDAILAAGHRSTTDGHVGRNGSDHRCGLVIDGDGLCLA